MRVIFDLGHPAHFHLFKHVISALKNSGHDVEIIARQKGCLPELLEATGWPYHSVARKANGLIALGWQQAKALRVAVSLARQEETDFIVGTSAIAGPAARLTGATSLIFNEDDAKAVPIFAKSAYPLAHYIVTPDCLKFENYGSKHLTYPGYHELAYLHPNWYQPDMRVRENLGLAPNERCFLIRLVALTAHHDISEKGVSTAQAVTLVKRLAEHGRVFISAEERVESELEPYLLSSRAQQIFDVMSVADMVIGDSQTMTAEAAVLGTPALRCNTFVGRLTYLEELEHRFGLCVGIRPADFEALLAQLDQWLSQPDLKQQWQRKRQAMLAKCVDLTGWILELFEKLVRTVRPRRKAAPSSQ
jgi:predicted glycosyltransferase